MLTIQLRIPDAFHARARHALGAVSLAWGLPVRVVGADASGADVVYGEPGSRRDGDALFWPFDAALYDPATRCASRVEDGRTLWTRDGVAAADTDLVGGVHRLLTFQDESQIDETQRDRRGIFNMVAVPAPRRAVATAPMVEYHADQLFARLVAARPALANEAMPRWPDGKRWAVVLTHDTDAVRIGALAEMATNVGKALLRRDPVSIEMIQLGLKHGRAVTGNPLWGFPLWRDFERARGMRSAHYLFASMPGRKRDLNDCKSSVLDPATDWALLRSMADEGWEFGLHPPIGAKDDIDVFLWCKRALEAKLGRPIVGLRHHYWALDWRRPHLTYRKHENVGFRYDASIAWRDSTGFRAGTALPFRPFDPGRARPLDLIVLPTSLMDRHVLEHPGVPDPARGAAELFAAVRGVGGLAVLDWHTETACDRLRYPRFLSSLGEFLAPVLADDSAWIATPWQVAKHWHQRRMALEAASTRAIEVAGAPASAPTPPRALKVGLLGMPDNEATPALLRALEANGIDVQTVIYWRPAAKDQWKRVLNKLRSAGVAGVMTRVTQALARRARATAAAGAVPFADPFPHAARFEVPHHNSNECRDLIRREAIDVLIVATDAILTRKIFGAPRVATLNGHPGWVPTFRGLGSAYHQMRAGWALAVSVHEVNEGIDTGPCFVREWLDDPCPAPERFEAELTALRGRLFARVIDQLARGEARAIDTFLEPSAMTRGMPLAERRAIADGLRAGRTLAIPESLRDAKR